MEFDGRKGYAPDMHSRLRLASLVAVTQEQRLRADWLTVWPPRRPNEMRPRRCCILSMESQWWSELKGLTQLSIRFELR